MVTPKKFCARFPGPPNREIVPTPMPMCDGLAQQLHIVELHRQDVQGSNPAVEL